MKTSLSNHHLGCGENAELVTDSGAGMSEQPLEEGQPTAREDAPMNIDEEDDQMDEQQPNLQPQQGVQSQDVLLNIAVLLVRRRGRGRGTSLPYGNSSVSCKNKDIELEFCVQVANNTMQLYVKFQIKILYTFALFYDLAHGRGNQHPAAGIVRGARQHRQLPAGQYVPNYVWTDTAVDGNYRPRDIPFTGVEGLRNPMPQDAECIDYFKWYFTDEVIDIIYKETNRYAQQYIETNGADLRPKSIVHNWKPTDASEMKAFIGLCILMGIISKPRISMYWSTDSFYHTPMFGQVMPRIRFQLLQRFLHFQDNQDPTYDPNDPDRDRLFKVRIINMLKQNFNTVYYPPENLTIDESLVLFKERLLFKQYIKTKRSRFGIKMFELATTDGILLDFMIYQGNIEPTLVQPPGDNWLQTEQIPLTMIDPYLDRGHTLTIDNWYTTPRLADYLLYHSTKVVGTIRPNRKQFPKDFPDGKNMQKATAVFKQSSNILAMKY